MNQNDFVELLDHDVSSSIRNFTVAADLMNSPAPNMAFILELLRESIIQLRGIQTLIRTTDANLNTKNQGIAAQKTGEL
jgi:hypothetical protein